MAEIESFKVRKRTRINEYEVTERLGKGWEGEVYRVIETYSGGKRVLKLFDPKGYRSKQIKEYSKKFEKLAEVNGIIRYYHAGYWEKRNAYFLIMEYFEGKDLEKSCKKPWPIFKALNTVREIFKIIDECHAKEVCIGDIHPGNILMNHENRIKIIDIDFGAKFVKEHICKDVVAISKLFYTLIHNSNIPHELREVLPKREDAICKRYIKTSQVLKELNKLMGE